VTHHTEDDQRQRRHETGDQKGGVEVEKWILRTMLLAVTALGITAVMASLDDIKRYIKISRM
jgi:hypothetical protein